MTTIIVYTSIAHGNTEKVAKAMAEALSADITRTGETTPETVNNYDLVGFGSGIYNGKHHQEIFDLVVRLPASSGKKFFVFSTSGFGTTKPNEKLKKALEGKGFKVIGNFACKGFDTAGINKLYGGAAKGRPDDNDLQEARTFARKLIF
jgi:flavodoxin